MAVNPGWRCGSAEGSGFSVVFFHGFTIIDLKFSRAVRLCLKPTRKDISAGFAALFPSKIWGMEFSGGKIANTSVVLQFSTLKLIYDNEFDGSWDTFCFVFCFIPCYVLNRLHDSTLWHTRLWAKKKQEIIWCGIRDSRAAPVLLVFVCDVVSCMSLGLHVDDCERDLADTCVWCK